MDTRELVTRVMCSAAFALAATLGLSAWSGVAHAQGPERDVPIVDQAYEDAVLDWIRAGSELSKLPEPVRLGPEDLRDELITDTIAAHELHALVGGSRRGERAVRGWHDARAMQRIDEQRPFAGEGFSKPEVIELGGSASEAGVWLGEGSRWGMSTQGSGVMRVRVLDADPGARVLFDGVEISPGDREQLEALEAVGPWVSNAWLSVEGGRVRVIAEFAPRRERARDVLRGRSRRAARKRFDRLSVHNGRARRPLALDPLGVMFLHSWGTHEALAEIGQRHPTLALLLATESMDSCGPEELATLAAHAVYWMDELDASTSVDAELRQRWVAALSQSP